MDAVFNPSSYGLLASANTWTADNTFDVIKSNHCDARTSAGIHIGNATHADVAIFGAGGGQGTTFYGQINGTSLALSAGITCTTLAATSASFQITATATAGNNGRIKVDNTGPIGAGGYNGIEFFETGVSKAAFVWDPAQAKLRSTTALVCDAGITCTTLTATSTTASTSTTTGCATFGGGIGVAGAGYFGGDITTSGGDIVRSARVINSNAGGYSQLTLANTGTSPHSWTIGVGGSTTGVQSLYFFDDTAALQRGYIHTDGRLIWNYGITCTTLTASGRAGINGGTTNIGAIAVATASETALGGPATWSDKHCILGGLANGTAVTALGLAVNQSNEDIYTFALSPGVAWRKIRHQASEHHWHVSGSTSPTMTVSSAGITCTTLAATSGAEATPAIIAVGGGTAQGRVRLGSSGNYYGFKGGADYLATVIVANGIDALSLGTTGAATFAAGITCTTLTASGTIKSETVAQGVLRAATLAGGSYGPAVDLDATGITSGRRWAVSATGGLDATAPVGSLAFVDVASNSAPVYIDSALALRVVTTTASTSTTTGCATFAGGIGVAGAGYFGAGITCTTLTASGAATLGGNATSVHLLRGSGGTSLGSGAIASLGSDGAATAANHYNLVVNKIGVTAFWVGTNKDTPTGDIPANHHYLATFGSNESISLAIGDDAGGVSSVPLRVSASGVFQPGGTYIYLRGNATTDGSVRISSQASGSAKLEARSGGSWGNISFT